MKVINRFTIMVLTITAMSLVITHCSNGTNEKPTENRTKQVTVEELSTKTYPGFDNGNCLEESPKEYHPIKKWYE